MPHGYPLQICPAESPLLPRFKERALRRLGEDEGRDGPVLPSFLPVERFNPPHGLCVADFAQIPLCGRKVRMPENRLSDDFDIGLQGNQQVTRFRLH